MKNVLTVTALTFMVLVMASCENDGRCKEGDTRCFSYESFNSIGDQSWIEVCASEQWIPLKQCGESYGSSLHCTYDNLGQAVCECSPTRYDGCTRENFSQCIPFWQVQEWNQRTICKEDTYGCLVFQTEDCEGCQQFSGSPPDSIPWTTCVPQPPQP